MHLVAQHDQELPMTAVSAPPVPRNRRRKTRTPHHNPHPPIRLSEQRINEIDLFPGKEHMACPTCKRWCPLTGMGSQPKLVPHHKARAGQGPNHRCTIGSNRRVIVDISVGRWRTKMIESVPTAAARRATKVLPKPRTERPPATSQLKPTPLAAEKAGQDFLKHRKACTLCARVSRDSAAQPCPDGARLATTYMRLLRQEPQRAKVRQIFARERNRFDRLYARQAPRKRESEWAAALPSVREADRQRTAAPAGDAPSAARTVPLDPVTFRRAGS